MFENAKIGNTLSKLAVKIATSDGLEGSGIIYKPKNTKDKLFIITAQHCLRGEEYEFSPSLVDVKVYIKSDRHIALQPYHLTLNDNILYHDSKDIGILIVSENSIRDIIGVLPTICFIEDKIEEIEAVFFGHPKIFPNDISTRVNGQILLPNLNGLISIQTDLRSENYLTESTVLGLSGSGIGLVCAGNVFLLGVITNFEEWTRFKGLSISLVNETLLQYKYNSEPYQLIETNPKLIEGCRILNQNTIKTLENIIDKIDDIHIPRKNLIHEAEQKLRDNNVLIVYGSAGVGKSSFCKEFTEHLNQIENNKIISFSGLQICKSNSLELFASLGISGTFEEFLNSKDYIGDKILYLDSAEKAFEISQIDTLKELLQLSKRLPTLKIILSIRSYALTQTTFSILKELSIKNDKIEIPFLTDSEILPVIEAHPGIQSLLENKKIETLVRTPFYLKQVILISDDIKGVESEINEVSLKKKLWDRVVCKDETGRENLFQLIAIERAKSLTPYIVIDEGKSSVELKSLLHDNIIVQAQDNFGLKSFAPAHDIFEDWALVRYIAAIRSKVIDLKDFYNAIGSEYAIRKGFRFWIQEIFNTDQNAGEEITRQTLEQIDISSHWKDEVIISLLNSLGCLNFFKRNKGWLLNENAKLLIQVIHLLRTSCKQVNSRDVALSDYTDKIYQNSSSLKPKGNGWHATIVFINENLSELKNHKILIANLLIEWQNGLTSPINIESRHVFEIIFTFINDYLKDDQSNSKNDIGNYVSELIKLLLKLVEIATVEIESFITEAYAFLQKDNAEKDFDKKYSYRKKTDLYRIVLKYLLSWKYSESISKFLPELVCSISSSEWLAKPIIKSNKKPNYQSPFPIFEEDDTYGRFNIEDYYGLNRQTDRLYSPCSAYQTPILHLLNHNPKIGLQFIIAIINKTTDVYAKSKQYIRDNGQEVTIHLDKEKIIRAYGSDALWSMYRGSVVNTPDLLKSILMALEKWLFSLAQRNTLESISHLSDAMHFLYENSISISTTAVVASIATASPFLVGKKVLPLFSFEAGFIWDLHRKLKERDTFIAISYWDEPYLRSERSESFNLLHRKEDLELLAFKMSFYEGYCEKILQYIDGYYSDMKTSQYNKLYEHWAIILNRIDRRRYRFSKVETGYLLENQVLEENKADVEEARKMIEENDGISVWNWTNEVLTKKNIEENTWEKWLMFFDLCEKVIRKNSEDNFLYNNPAGIAAIGINYYLNKLNDEQKKWCIEIVINISTHFLSQEIHIGNFNLEYGQYSIVNKEWSYQTLPKLFQLELTEVDKARVEDLIIGLSYYIPISDNLNKPLFEKLAYNLWIYNKALARGLFRMFIFFSQNNLSDNQKSTFLSPSLLVDMKEIETGGFKDDYESRQYADRAFLFISESEIIDSEGYKFLKAYLALLVEDTFIKDLKNNWDDTKNEYYYGTLHFQSKLPKILFGEERALSKELFLEFLRYFKADDKKSEKHLSEDSFKFANDCLEYIILYEDDSAMPEKFNELWEILFSEAIKAGRMLHVSNLLLDIKWKDSATTWKAISLNPQLYINIITLFGLNNILGTLKLIGGIGFETLFLNTLMVIAHLSKTIENKKWVLNYHAEKYIQRGYYISSSAIKNNAEYRKNFLIILDTMIDNGSSIAYLVRENIVSL